MPFIIIFAITLTITLICSGAMHGMDPEATILTITPDDRLDVSSEENDILHQAISQARELVYKVLPVTVGMDEIQTLKEIGDDKSSQIPSIFKRLSYYSVLTYDKKFKTMELWDLDKNICAPRITLRNVPTQPEQICCDLEGQQLAAIFKGGNIKAWDIGGSSGEPLTEFQDAELVQSMLCAKNYLVIGTADGKVKFWDLNTQEYVAVRKEHTQAITCMTSLENGSVAVGSQDGYASVYDLANRMCYLRLNNQEPVRFITNIKTNGVVTSSEISGCKVWDTQQKKCISSYYAKNERERILAIEEIAGMIALYYKLRNTISDRELRLINPKNGQCLVSIDLTSQCGVQVLRKEMCTYTVSGEVYNYDLRFACLSDEALVKAAQLLKEQMLKHHIDDPLKTYIPFAFNTHCRYITNENVFNILKQASS